MTEQILKEYFDGKVPLNTLASDLMGSQVKTGQDITSVCVISITDKREYVITRKHLIKLCSDTLKGYLTETDLNTVAFSLIVSDYFRWDDSTIEGEIVTNTLFDWDNPDINFPMTTENLLLWKK